MSVDKLGQSSVNDTFDREYILRIVLVIVVIVGALIGGLIYFSDSEPEPTGDESFNIQYSDVGVLVTQTSGDLVEDNAKLRLNYRNGEQLMRNMSINSLHDTEIVVMSKEVYQLQSSEVVWVNDGEVVQVLESQQLTEDYTPEEPEVNSEEVDLRVGESIELDAENYVNSELEITDYEWTVGKQELGPRDFIPSQTQREVINDKTVTLEFDEVGVYTADLKATDEIGNTGTGRFDISVESPSLFTMEDSTYNASAGEPFNLDGTDLTTTEATDYTWNIGDAEYNSPELTHTFETSGSKQVKLTVEDSFGYESTRVISVQVLNDKSLNLNYESVGDGEYQFSADTQGISVDSYEWSFGEDVNANTNDSTVTYNYESDGSYTVTVTATTSTGATVSDTTSVSVDDQSTVNIQMSSNLGTAWTVESVEGASVDDVLPNDNIGDQNPDIRLEQGERYVFEGLNDEHPIEFRDLFGDAVLSQTTTTAYEENSDWTDSGATVAFTVTEDLPPVIDGYQSATNPSNMDGQILFN